MAECGKYRLMRPKTGWIAAAGLFLALLAGGAVLRPDPGTAADELARAVGGRLGLPAIAVGPARYAWAWPLRLEVPAIDIPGLGRLENVVVAERVVGATATFFGRTGAFAWQDDAVRFDADGVAARLDRSDGRLRVETTLAGEMLRVSGRPVPGGLDALEIGWGGHALAGAARYQAGLSAVAVEATSAGAPAIRLTGRYLPGETAFEGVLEAEPAGGGRVRAELRVANDEIDVARFEIGTPGLVASGSARRDAKRAALDLRVEEIALPAFADLAARHLGALAGDIDLRLRIGRLTWAAGDAQGIILVAAREGGRVVVDELAIRAIGEASLRVRDGILDLQAPDAGRFLAALGMPVERHLGALALRGTIAVDTAAPALRVAPLELTLAGQRMRGEIGWQAGRVALALAGERVVLDPFFARPMRPPPVRGPLLTRSQAARAAAAAAPPEPGPGGWARTPIVLDLVGGIPVDITLSARELVFDKITLGDARVSAAHDPAGLAVQSLSGSLLGGAFTGNGRLDSGRSGGGRPRFDMRFTLAGADWVQVLAAFGAAPVLRGPVSLSGDFAAGGANASALVGDLAGTLALESPGGSIEGLDLPGLIAHAAGARSADLVELGRRAARGGRSAFSGASGTWRIERGRARSTDTRIVAPGGALEIAGEFDLPNWRIDMSASVAARGASTIPRLALAGPPARANVTLSAAPANASDRPADSGAARPRVPAVRR